MFTLNFHFLFGEQHLIRQLTSVELLIAKMRMPLMITEHIFAEFRDRWAVPITVIVDILMLLASITVEFVRANNCNAFNLIYSAPVPRETSEVDLTEPLTVPVLGHTTSFFVKFTKIAVYGTIVPNFTNLCGLVMVSD